MSTSLREAVSIIIPTYDNHQQLTQCVTSLVTSAVFYPLDIIVINNGSEPIKIEGGGVRVINTGKNLGWEGGLLEGLKHTTSKYVCFMNDDTYIPASSCHWMDSMVRSLEIHPEIAAIGPSSNVVMGSQNIWSGPFHTNFITPFLIGYCMLVRRSALDEVGGIDATAPGGDDIDLSIRFRKAGYHLLVAKWVFVYHHGFQTGNRLFGDANKTGGWNSFQMTERTNDWLIRKHGFLAWWETIVSPVSYVQSAEDHKGGNDTEGDVVREFIKGETVIEMGVGGQKTVPHAVGVDIIPKGDPIPFVDQLSEADIIADVSGKIPTDEKFDTLIARHVLEHVVDTIQTLKNWASLINPGGRIIISVPDERVTPTIPMNPEHVHAFTPGSLKNLGEAAGLTPISLNELYNGVSFTIVFEV